MLKGPTTPLLENFMDLLKIIIIIVLIMIHYRHSSNIISIIGNQQQAISSYIISAIRTSRKLVHAIQYIVVRIDVYPIQYILVARIGNINRNNNHGNEYGTDLSTFSGTHHHR